VNILIDVAKLLSYFVKQLLELVNRLLSATGVFTVMRYNKKMLFKEFLKSVIGEHLFTNVKPLFFR
jgi:hypothetical protein